MMALLQYLNFLGGTTALVNLSTNSFCTMERTILHEIVHGLGGKVFEILKGQLISKCPFGVKTSSK